MISKIDNGDGTVTVTGLNRKIECKYLSLIKNKERHVKTLPPTFT